MTTGKTIALSSRTFVGKEMSLLSNMLSRLVIAFLPGNKSLLKFDGCSHHLQWFWSPPKKSLSLFPLFPHLFAMKWSDLVPSMILLFLMLSFKPTFSLSSLTFIKRLFSSSSFSSIRPVSYVCLMLLIFHPAILIPTSASSSLQFCVVYDA